MCRGAIFIYKMASVGVLWAVCLVCRRRSFSLTAAGLIRAHGPADNRCPGSCELPAVVPCRSPATSVLDPGDPGPRGTSLADGLPGHHSPDRWSLSSQVNKQLWEEEDPPTPTRTPRRGKGKAKDPMEYLGRRFV